MTEPTTSGRNVLFSCLLMEDYMSMLRGMVVLAWACLGVALLTQVSIRVWHELPWPKTDGFDVAYNVTLLEFGMNTLALTALLFYRDWYERIPRQSAHRLRWLLLAVLVWFGLHLFVAFHVTGGIHGPMILLLPLMIGAAFIALPGHAGWMLAGYLLLGHLLVIVLEQFQVIPLHGALSAHLSLAPPLSAWTFATLCVVLAIALGLSLAVSHWMHGGGESLSLVNRVDVGTGLFRRAFLMKRMKMELGRIRRQGGSSALLLVALDEDKYHWTLRGLAEVLVKQLRLGSDTPALYERSVMAALLPAADDNGAIHAAQRVVEALSKVSGSREHLATSVVIVSAGDVTVDQFLSAADVAMRQSVVGGDLVVHRLAHRPIGAEPVASG